MPGRGDSYTFHTCRSYRKTGLLFKVPLNNKWSSAKIIFCLIGQLLFFEHRHSSRWGETALGVRNSNQKSDIHRFKLATSMLFLSLFILWTPSSVVPTLGFYPPSKSCTNFSHQGHFIHLTLPTYLHPSCECSAQTTNRVKRHNLWSGRTDPGSERWRSR